MVSVNWIKGIRLVEMDVIVSGYWFSRVGVMNKGIRLVGVGVMVSGLI